MDIGKFYETVVKLKEIKRRGWIERGVKDPESISDHSFMVALLCLIVPKQGIDKNKAVKMALVHDLAESITGDYISTENWSGGTISKEEQLKKEEQAMKEILPLLDNETAKEIVSLWKEYEEGETTEARFVKDVDALEVLLQAYDYYSKKNYEKDLTVFWDKKGLNRIKDQNIKKLVKDIIDKGW